MLTIGDVMLQITSPRIPCATYASVTGGKAALKDFYAAERPGAYARVLQTGDLCAGQPVTLTPYDGDRISIIDNMRAYRTNFADPAFLTRALGVPAHYKLHAEARARLADEARGMTPHR